MADEERQPLPSDSPSSAETEQHPIYVLSVADGRLWQGEILTGLEELAVHIPSLTAGQTPLTFKTILHRYAVVVSRDCDLRDDFQWRSSGSAGTLDYVSFCDAYEETEYHEECKRRLNIGSKEWRHVRENHDERFEFLEAAPQSIDLSGEGLPALIVDLRVSFTIRTDEVYERLKLTTKRRCRLNMLYCEHLAHRHHCFQSSIPLPRPHRK